MREKQAEEEATLRTREVKGRVLPVGTEEAEPMEEAGIGEGLAHERGGEEEAGPVEAAHPEAAHVARPAEEHRPRPDRRGRPVDLEHAPAPGHEGHVVEGQHLGPVREIEAGQARRKAASNSSSRPYFVEWNSTVRTAARKAGAASSKSTSPAAIRPFPEGPGSSSMTPEQEVPPAGAGGTTHMLSCVLLAVLQAAALTAPSGSAPRDLPFSQGWESQGRRRQSEATTGARPSRLGTGWAYRRDVQLARRDHRARREGHGKAVVRVRDLPDGGRPGVRGALPAPAQVRPSRRRAVRPGAAGQECLAAASRAGGHGRGALRAWEVDAPSARPARPHGRALPRHREQARVRGAARSGAASRVPRVARVCRRSERRARWRGSPPCAPGPRPRRSAADLLPPAPVDPPGVVKAWAVSDALAPLAEPPLAPPPAQGYRAVPAEPGGLVSLLRHVKVPPDAKSWTTTARLHVRAEAAGPETAGPRVERHRHCLPEWPAALPRRRSLLLRQAAAGGARPSRPGFGVPAPRGRRQRARRGRERRLRGLGGHGPFSRRPRPAHRSALVSLGVFGRRQALGNGGVTASRPG